MQKNQAAGAEAARPDLMALARLPLLVKALDAQDRVVFWSDECVRVTGCSAAEALSDPWFVRRLFPVGCGAEHALRSRSGEPLSIAWLAMPRPPSAAPQTRWFIGSDVTAAQRTRAALRASEARYRQLVDASRDLIALQEPDGRYRYVSPVVTDLLGYTAGELLGRRPFAFMHPEDPRDLYGRAHEQVLAGQSQTTVHYRFRRKDGRYVWLETLVAPLFEDATDPTRVTAMLTTSRDVSDKLDAAQRLATSEERLRLALLATGVGICDVPLPAHAGPSAYFSDEYLHIYGYGPAQREGFERGWSPLVHPADAEAFGADNTRCERGEADAFDQETRRMHADGRYIWVRSIGRVVAHDAAGRARRIIGTLRDVTERKAHEAALRASAGELEHAQALAGLGRWSWAIEGDRVSWSAEMFRILGLAPGGPAPPYAEHARLFTPDSWQRLRAAVDAAVTARAAYDIELEVVRGDGRTCWTRARGDIETGAQGRLVGLFGTLQDINDHKLAEHELREARDRVRALSSHAEDELNRERKRIAADVHDELGQMLTAMRLQLDLLRSRMDDHAALERSAERLSELIENTVEITRNVAMNLSPPALDLGLVPALEWLAEDFSLRYDLPCGVFASLGELPLSDKQATQLFRIAQEALTNVARHAGASRVDIRLERLGAAPGTGLELGIRDNGVGFDPAAVPANGHFGLFGMRERALRLGANLHVDSRAGQGTEVWLRLPGSAPGAP